jgi:hypothetical protein
MPSASQAVRSPAAAAAAAAAAAEPGGAGLLEGPAAAAAGVGRVLPAVLDAVCDGGGQQV